VPGFMLDAVEVLGLCSAPAACPAASSICLALLTWPARHRRTGMSTHTSFWTCSYLGKDVSTASNIVFANGDLDPWSGGGVLEVHASFSS